MTKLKKFTPYLAISFLSLLVGGLLFYFLAPEVSGYGKVPPLLENKASETTAESTTIAKNISQNLNLGPYTIADMVEKVGPAVVNIDVVKMQKTRVIDPFKMFERDFGFGFNLDPRFKDFYEDKIIPVKGAGSGFIIDKKGHIITNNHVINGADEIKVTLNDGRRFDAKLIGSDSDLDIAVIKISAKDFATVKMGNSEKIRPGEWVVAIGNPYQFSNSVTTGIISATSRDIGEGKKGLTNLIQTDAPINPGNSGGPLLNLKGEVIGVNVAIISGAQGIGFAIPINAAKDILDELITKGKITRPWIGIYMRDVDQKIANYLELPIAQGVIIVDVAKDSPADKAKLKKYDVIRKINGQKIKTSSEVKKAIEKKKPRDRIKVTVWRDGKLKELRITLGEKP